MRTRPDPVAELRQSYRDAVNAFGPGYEPPFPFVHPRSGQLVVVPLREWLTFAERVAAREMVEGISFRGMVARWDRYRMAGTAVSKVSVSVPTVRTADA